MKIFDTHTHCFPDALAPKALPHLALVCGSPYYGSGTYDDLKEKVSAAGGCGALILHIATKPTQMTSVNHFAAACQNGNFYSFGSVFPTCENAVDELYRIQSLGLKGVKLHPDYQGFFVDDPAVFPVYETASKLRLPIAFHTGFDPYSPNVVHCPPKALAAVADRFPALTIIAAHMGGMRMDKEVEAHLIGKENVYFDTAYTTYSMNAARCGELIRRHGIEKVLFATDFPWSTVEAELSLLQQCGFTEDELEQICFKNAERLLQITL